MKTYKDWICRYYSEHEDGEPDGEIIQELIRCKDCKYSHKCGGDMLMRSASGGYIYCPLGADGYCSMGERKEE